MLLIGLDDTDNATSKGTGHLARLLSAACAARGMRPLGVTRHQFLVDPRIPYTSHNSGACVAVECEDIAAAAFAFDFVASRAADGSDPGVCVAEATAAAALADFGWAATRDVLEMDEAFARASRAGVELQALGGSGQGVIGALASVALRADGNEGRFIDMPGLRELPEIVDAAAIERLGIALEHDGRGRYPSPADRYNTLGWVRPRLSGGRAVLPVEWCEAEHEWIVVDRKKSRPLE